MFPWIQCPKSDKMYECLSNLMTIFNPISSHSYYLLVCKNSEAPSHSLLKLIQEKNCVQILIFCKQDSKDLDDDKWQKINSSSSSGGLSLEAHTFGFREPPFSPYHSTYIQKRAFNLSENLALRFWLTFLFCHIQHVTFGDTQFEDVGTCNSLKKCKTKPTKHQTKPTLMF